jgi:hypothetical protein
MCHGYDGTPGRAMTQTEETTLQLATAVVTAPIGGAVGLELKAAGAAATATELSVESKLANYLLNPNHAGGGASKAEWFEKALGFNLKNSEELASQVVFDAKKAVQTSVTQYGTKFNQTISIAGANGRTIDVVFGWIRNSSDNVVRLVTAIPAKP